MRFDEEQTLLAAAAVPILERIRGDQKTASAQVQPLLRYLEDHLFDPELYVDSWLRACGVSDHLTTARFHKEIGLGPTTYLWDCRLHTASRLLRDSSLAVSTVGRVVGFSDRKIFETGFEDWSSEPPVVYRRKARARAAAYGPAPEWMLSTPFLRRLEAGELTPEEARAAKERLRHLIGVKDRQEGGYASGDLDSEDDKEGFERWMALKLWEKIERLPFKEQKLFVANQVAYRTTALCDLLLEKSEEGEGLASRQLEHLADLAEEALERTLSGQTGLRIPS